LREQSGAPVSLVDGASMLISFTGKPTPAGGCAPGRRREATFWKALIRDAIDRIEQVEQIADRR